jgi:dihydroflavonol-4-reductase
VLAAVTGGSGHLGANLVRVLLAAGHRVRALVHRDTRALDGLDVARVAGDVLDPATLPALVSGADVVFHLAGCVSIAGDPNGLVLRTNVEGTRHVAAACLEARVRRLVHVGSIHVYTGHPLDAIVDESRPLADTERRPAPYDRSKALAQREALAAAARGLDAVSLHPTAIVGPHDFKGSRTGQVLAALAAGRMPALVDGGFDWVDARDVSAALLSAAERGRRSGSYLLPGHWRSVAELARAVAGCGGAAPPRLVVPLWLARAGAPLVEAGARLAGTEPLFTREAMETLRKHRRISGDRARRELGWDPRPFEETVRDSLAWLRANGGGG